MTEDTIDGMKEALENVRKSKECLGRILSTHPDPIPLVMRGWIIHLYAETEEVEDGISREIRVWQNHFGDEKRGVEE